MILIGNPPYYVLVYGGYSEQTILDTDNTTTTIHTVIDDLWSFSIYSQKWQ